MRAFEVKSGTVVRVIENSKEWVAPNFVEHECKNDNLFFLEDVAIDPLGKQGPDPNGVTIGGYYAKMGYYGFARDRWTLLVPMDKVIVH